MMTSEQKERRYFPDDPYEKYNKISYLKQKYSLEKNKKLIEEHGNKVYKYDRYKAHRDYLSHYNDLPKEQYMPPGMFFTYILNLCIILQGWRKSSKMTVQNNFKQEQLLLTS